MLFKSIIVASLAATCIAKPLFRLQPRQSGDILSDLNTIANAVTPFCDICSVLASEATNCASSDGSSIDIDCFCNADYTNLGLDQCYTCIDVDTSVSASDVDASDNAATDIKTICYNALGHDEDAQTTSSGDVSSSTSSTPNRGGNPTSTARPSTSSLAQQKSGAGQVSISCLSLALAGIVGLL
ncbi:hypothetical protein E5Q_00204 [Mixia osmundae IAM 14324]|uniref:Extracellular membrane protein CFEM domain-containing protein n=2 Tax=Mixia osmundae (strain CBS 9802 / IAM 14324 / JCM 22182 / KY 12970) TaxID=764103 RepID=G7DSK0_MIXOS|nr:hypothetical protein E5Q_00204 [Mixia osmundae IAM 14324]